MFLSCLVPISASLNLSSSFRVMSHKNHLHAISRPFSRLCWFVGNRRSLADKRKFSSFQRRRAFPCHVTLQVSHVKSPWTCKPLENILKWPEQVWVICWSVSVSFVWLYNMRTALCLLPGVMWLNVSCFETKPPCLKTKKLSALQSLLFYLWLWIVNNFTKRGSSLAQDMWEIWCSVTEYFSH